ncbi:hypothetical protein AcW1_009972 [Taiwanofungus camphoratus]|nr:hypothetical protein AcV5_003194 [Antrodia cinnamomea]KAI0929477.1 hypothetical protein AcV7_005321 [Antrodia cinnamomea]KAI0946532.1 hypothetical protein AcW1_009972 [Antrodia cinnamomea]
MTAPAIDDPQRADALGQPLRLSGMRGCSLPRIPLSRRVPLRMQATLLLLRSAAVAEARDPVEAVTRQAIYLRIILDCRAISRAGPLGASHEYAVPISRPS